jgi:hypothetical protein
MFRVGKQLQHFPNAADKIMHGFASWKGKTFILLPVGNQSRVSRSNFCKCLLLPAAEIYLLQPGIIDNIFDSTAALLQLINCLPCTQHGACIPTVNICQMTHNPGQPFKSLPGKADIRTADKPAPRRCCGTMAK